MPFRILFSLAAVVAVVVARRPSAYRVSRSLAMAVPAVNVFAEVNDLRRWRAWSPWADLDPRARVAFDGAPAGPGASMAWAGDKRIGEGRMTIVESRPAERIRLRLEFFKPFKGTSEAEFVFRTEEDRTVVTWTATGRNNFMAKAAGVFMDCDKSLGDRYEKGLASMKALVESR